MTLTLALLKKKSLPSTQKLTPIFKQLITQALKNPGKEGLVRIGHKNSVFDIFSSQSETFKVSILTKKHLFRYLAQNWGRRKQHVW